MPKKHMSPEQKLKIVLEALKEERQKEERHTADIASGTLGSGLNNLLIPHLKTYSGYFA